MSAEAFPFLFYGASPDDWFDEPVHAWQLRFARAPSAPERARVAAAWESASAALARGLSADFSAAWWWADAWALCPVRVGDRSRETMRALFEAMQGVLRAVHAAAPLAEAVHAQAIDLSSGSAWEAWTLAQAPTPSEPPTWPDAVTTHAKRSRRKAKGAVDEAFEAARKAARGGAVTPSTVARDPEDEAPEDDEVPKDDEVPEDNQDDDAEEEDGSTEDDAPDEPTRAPRGFALRVAPADAAALEERMVAAAKRANDALGEAAEQIRDGSGWCAAVKRSKKDKDPRLAAYVGGEVRATVHPAAWLYSVYSWSAARASLLLHDDEGRGLVAVALDRDERRRVWDDPVEDGVEVAFWLGDGVFAGAVGRVWTLQPAGDGFAPGGFYTLSAEQGTALPTPDGRGVVVYQRDVDGFVQVVVPVGGALRVAGEGYVTCGGYASLVVDGGAVYVTDGEEAWRLDGVGEAIDALLAAPGDGERFPELPRTQSPDERKDPARNADAAECQSRAEQRMGEGDLPGAEVWLRRALSLDATNTEAKHLLGRVLVKTGRGAEARPFLEAVLACWQEAAAEAPDDDEPTYQRAQVLALLGRREDALAALRAYVATGGNAARTRARREDDLASLHKDAEFLALTERVARAKKAAKKAAKRAEADDAGDDEEG
jgi:tetratricopeptide (TPR) repeat protein